MFISPLEEIAPSLGAFEKEPSRVFLGMGHGQDETPVAEAFHLL